MIKIKKPLFSSLIIICLLNIHIITAFAQDYSQLLVEINNNINEAYEIILQAEQNGANIEELTDLINDTIDLFQQMKYDVYIGNTNDVNLHAEECISLCSEIISKAQALIDTVVVQTRTRIQRNILFSVVAAVIVIVTSLLLWSKFKKFYLNQLLNAKPVVIQNES